MSLNLGGRYILLKSILESIPIYWLSLSKVPKSILDKFCSLCYGFLWSRNKEENTIPMVKWNQLARLKSMGGWGFKNLFLFGRALVAKIIWCCLVDDGLWGHVRRSKYFKLLLSPWLDPHSSISSLVAMA